MTKQYTAALLIFILMTISARADRVTVKDGTHYDGAILEADSAFIYVQLDVESLAKIPHGLVEKVVFQYADVVYLLDGKELKCKILGEKFPDMRIVTANGQQFHKLVDLKRYFYNSQDSLIAPELPSTGALFNNVKSIQQVAVPFKQTISLSISGGIINPPVSAWRENFITTSSPTGALAQGQIDLALVKFISVTLGYTYTEYRYTAEQDLDSEIITNYYHLGVNYTPKLAFLPFVDFTLGGDIGLLKTEGSLYSYSYRQVNLDNLTPGIAYRPRLTATAYVSENLSVGISVGYLIAQEKQVDMGDPCKTKISIPLSGATIYAGVAYHIPINLW